MLRAGLLAGCLVLFMGSARAAEISIPIDGKASVTPETTVITIMNESPKEAGVTVTCGTRSQPLRLPSGAGSQVVVAVEQPGPDCEVTVKGGPVIVQY